MHGPPETLRVSTLNGASGVRLGNSACDTAMPEIVRPVELPRFTSKYSFLVNQNHKRVRSQRTSASANRIRTDDLLVDGGPQLAQGFVTPPDSAKPRTWWH